MSFEDHVITGDSVYITHESYMEIKNLNYIFKDASRIGVDNILIGSRHCEIRIPAVRDDP